MKLTTIIIALFSLFCISNIYGQDISGTWNWEYKNKHSSAISLKKINSDSYKGRYCSVYYNGNRIDCSVDDNDHGIYLNKVSNNVFEGSFKSFYSGTTGKMRLEYLPVTNKIKITILEKPKGEYYLPDKVDFNRN